MSFAFQPWHLLGISVADTAQQDYEKAIEYLLTEIRTYKKLLGKKRLPLSNDDRRKVAVKARAFNRRTLEQVATICTPDTILRWHRELVAKKWNYSQKRKTPGRPKVVKEIEELVLRMPKENPSWGDDRIQGALATLSGTKFLTRRWATS